jgi:hypothetical protein
MRKVFPLLAFVLPFALWAQTTGESVSTIAALRAKSVSDVADGACIVLAGYHSATEGPNAGGGLFRYDLSCTAADDGGITLAPTTGDGRWIRQFSGPVNVRWYGAKGDGSTDDSASLQKAGNAALALGCTLYVPPGRYLIRAGPTFYGNLHMIGDGKASMLQGTRVYGGHALDIGLNLHVQTLFSENHQPAGAISIYMATGSLAAGMNTLTLGTVSGLSVGAEVLVEYGQDANDSTLPDDFNWCRITHISSRTVTLDAAPSRTIHGTTHHLYLVSKPAKGVDIENIGLDRMAIAVPFCQGVALRNIYQEHGYCLLNYGQSTIGLNVDNVVIEEALCAPRGWVQAGVYGSSFYGYASRDIFFRDIVIRRQHFGNPFDNDGDGENITVDGLEVDFNPAFDGTDDTGQVTIFAAPSTFRGVWTVRNATLTSQVPSARVNTDEFTLAGGPEHRYENIRFEGNPDSASLPSGLQPFQFSPRCFGGELDYLGYQFTDIQGYRRIVPLTASMNAEIPLGVSGLLRTVQVYVSDASHITHLFYNSGGNHSSSLVSGRFVDLSSFTTTYASRPINGIEVKMDVATDSGTVAGTYMVVEGTYYTMSGSYMKTTDVVYGSGAPTVNAQFKGQVYFNVADNSEYRAVAVGTGSGDWVKRGR